MTDPVLCLHLTLATGGGAGYVHEPDRSAWRLPQRDSRVGAALRDRMEALGRDDLPCTVTPSVASDPTLCVELEGWDRDARSLAEELLALASRLDCRLFAAPFLDTVEQLAGWIASHRAWRLAHLVRADHVSRIRDHAGVEQRIRGSAPSVLFSHAIWSGPSVSSLSVLTAWLSRLPAGERAARPRIHVVDIEAVEAVARRLRVPLRIGGNGELLRVGDGAIAVLAPELPALEDVERALGATASPRERRGDEAP